MQKKMTNQERAKIFAPFDALKGFKEALKENHVTANGLRQAFQMAGSDGQVAFNNLIGQLGRLDTGIKRTSSAVDKMYVTFQNTFR